MSVLKTRNFMFNLCYEKMHDNWGKLNFYGQKLISPKCEC